MLFRSRALSDERGLAGAIQISEEAREQIVRMAGSDARKALTLLEAAAGTVLAQEDDLSLLLIPLLRSAPSALRDGAPSLLPSGRGLFLSSSFRHQVFLRPFPETWPLQIPLRACTGLTRPDTSPRPALPITRSIHKAPYPLPFSLLKPPNPAQTIGRIERRQR